MSATEGAIVSCYEQSVLAMKKSVCVNVYKERKMENLVKSGVGKLLWLKGHIELLEPNEGP